MPYKVDGAWRVPVSGSLQLCDRGYSRGSGSTMCCRSYLRTLAKHGKYMCLKGLVTATIAHTVTCRWCSLLFH